MRREGENNSRQYYVSAQQIRERTTYSGISLLPKESGGTVVPSNTTRRRLLQRQLFAPPLTKLPSLCEKTFFSLFSICNSACNMAVIWQLDLHAKSLFVGDGMPAVVYQHFCEESKRNGRGWSIVKRSIGDLWVSLIEASLHAKIELPTQPKPFVATVPRPSWQQQACLAWLWFCESHLSLLSVGHYPFRKDILGEACAVLPKVLQV